MIATTTSNSIRVKPFDFFCFILEPLLPIRPPFWMGVWSFRTGRLGRQSKRGAMDEEAARRVARATRPAPNVRKVTGRISP